MFTRIITTLFILLSVSAMAAGELPEIIYVAPSTDIPALALLLPMSNGEVLEGISWFNNDSETVFPEIMLTPVDSGGLPDLTNSLTVATDISGDELKWSEFNFDQGIISSVGDLFLIIRFPQGEIGSGYGVGPGIGYVLTESDVSCYMSSDFSNWSKVDRLAVHMEPIYGNGQASSSTMMFAVPETPVFNTELKGSFPNPFNPSTKIIFTLSSDQKAEISLFDIRGKLVKTLCSEIMTAGRHELIWDGTNSNGNRMASGVYLLKMTTPDLSTSCRMMMVR